MDNKEPVCDVAADLIERLLARVRNGEVKAVSYEFVDHFDTVGDSCLMVEHDVRRLTINFGPKKGADSAQTNNGTGDAGG